MSTSDLVATARQLATRAHAGQRDKGGVDYIGHPARVAGRVRGDDAAEAVGWLHDVVEDTEVTVADLREIFPATWVAAVEALTRREDDAGDDYYARVRADPLALTVKVADIADNTDPARTVLLDSPTRHRLAVKYAHALQKLTTPPR